MPTQVGILLTHPTQYHSPWFKELASRTEIEIEVFYCFQPDADQQGIDFGVAFEWDVPLLDGYRYTFLKNVAREPGFDYAGCDTPEIAQLISSKKCDAWIVNGWKVKSDWQAIRSCWRSRTPVLIRGDSNLIDSKPLHLRFAKRLILGRWIPRFSRYLTVGKLNEEFYRFYGADPSRFVPVRHYVDNDRFALQAAQAQKNAATIRSEWGIPEKPVFLFAGKFIEKKRPMDAIKAVELLTSEGSDIHLLMVGDGALRNSCEEYARTRQLPISFTGFLNQNEISKAYGCSNVLLLPSGYGETWGLVVNEAMSCGLPAIVSDRVGCGPDLISNGKTGFVFPVGDIKALSEAMQVYVNDLALAEKHGIQARERVRAYDVRLAAQNTAEAVLSLEINGTNSNAI